MKKPEKIELGIFPTPLQELKNIGKLLGDDKQFFMKREDLCGIGLGGNKVRKLEYLLAEALAQGCGCVVTGGGSQSNQTIAAAACANRVGLETHLVVPASTGMAARGLGELLGVVFHEVDSANDLQKGIRAAAAELRDQGKKPYIIPPGASTTLGVLGYVDAMRELFEQAAERHLHIGHVVCCGGTGNTYAGVVLGTKLYGSSATATVVSIGRRFCHKSTLCEMARKAEKLLDCQSNVTEDDMHIYFCGGKGLGIPSPKGKTAMQYMAAKEGIFLDPVYTGKAFAGLLDMNQAGTFQKGEVIVFIHTGGTTTLFNSLI